MRIPVTGTDFATLLATMKGMLKEQNVQFEEERDSLPGEITVTLRLPDVSLFDK